MFSISVVLASVNCCINCTYFIFTVLFVLQPDKELWVKAQEFAKSGVQELTYKYQQNAEGFIFPNSKTLQSLQTLQTAAERRRQLHDSAIEFKRLIRSPADFKDGLEVMLEVSGNFYFLAPSSKPSTYVLYDCTCPQYAKKSICKHCLGWAILKEEIAIPENRDATRLDNTGARNGPGRPRSVGPAWSFQ